MTASGKLSAKTYINTNSQIIAQHDGDDSNDLYFYLPDRLGSVRQVIDSDANVVNYYTYQPFGETFATEVNEMIVNPFQFTGQFFDFEIDGRQHYFSAEAIMEDEARDVFLKKQGYQIIRIRAVNIERYPDTVRSLLSRLA